MTASILILMVYSAPYLKTQEIPFQFSSAKSLSIVPFQGYPITGETCFGILQAAVPLPFEFRFFALHLHVHQ
jgi:4-hydroxybenzoate polyprenyltransferase